MKKGKEPIFVVYDNGGPCATICKAKCVVGRPVIFLDYSPDCEDEKRMVSVRNKGAFTSWTAEATTGLVHRPGINVDEIVAQLKEKGLLK